MGFLRDSLLLLQFFVRASAPNLHSNVKYSVLKLNSSFQITGKFYFLWIDIKIFRHVWKVSENFNVEALGV